jgi:hypothetical protein
LTKLRTKTPSALNQHSAWNQYLKPWFNVEAFQKRINDRVGLSRTGQPIVRLVWGQDIWQEIWGERTPRYWVRRLRRGADITWYTIPRWILESRIEPEQYADAWEKTRYSLRDPLAGDGFKCEDCGTTREPRLIGNQVYCAGCAGTNVKGGAVVDKGPPPSEMYVYMAEVAEHEGLTDKVSGWPHCCTRAFYTDRSRCWGKYRPPADLELAVVQRTIEALNSSRSHDPYKPVTPAELAEMELASNLQVERAQLEFEEYERQLREEVLKTYPYPGFELGASHFSDPGPSFRIGEQHGIILTDAEAN